MKALFYLVVGFVLLFAGACQSNYSPKPRGYFRIDFPAKQYYAWENNFPYQCSLPVYAQVNPYQGRLQDDPRTENWINVDFPNYSAHIHLTYKTVDENLKTLIDDAHTFAYKHVAMAEAINQIRFEFSEKKVNGVIYEIKGNTASAVQFFCTDSTQNFLRGALYFDAEPNKDSLAPLVDFFYEDIQKLIETLQWKSSVGSKED